MALENHKNLSVLILAGTREEDPLLQEFGIKNKAFINIYGKSSIEWVLDAVLNTPELKNSQVYISHQECQTDLFQEKLKKYKFSSVINNSNSPVIGIKNLFQAPQPPKGGVLIVTADNPLINPEIIQYFLRKIKTDIAYGVVNITPQPPYKGETNTRTWFKINKLTWLSGANIFYFSSACVPNYQKLLDKVWIAEKYRKSPFKFFNYFANRTNNFFFLLKVLLQKSSLEECNKVLSDFLGFSTELVTLPFEYACIDLDKKSDYDEISQIMSFDSSKCISLEYQPQN